jgi:hypothetical protein
MMLLAGCGGTPAQAGASVWIDVPVDGITLPAGLLVNIEGHAASKKGISRVEIWVNGALQTTLGDLKVTGGLAYFVYSWLPPSAGDYTIQALSFASDGSASDPDITRIHVGDVTATPVPLPDLAIVSVEAFVEGYKGTTPFCNTRVVYTNAGSAPVPVDFAIQFAFDGVVQQTVTMAGGLPAGATAEAVFVYQFTDMHYIGINLDQTSLVTEISEANNAFAEARLCQSDVTPPPEEPTPTTPSGAVIQFWADPPEINAGECTTLYWHAENVQRVVFGGVEQPLDGSYRDCLCSTQSYPLTVTLLDGTEDRRVVTVNVNGSCVTPPPPPQDITPVPPEDTTPPPAPSPAVPADGLSIACKGSQNLVWLPVNDESGIGEYQVQVQRHSGDNNWQAVSGSPFTGISGKTMNLPVECGWYYRWRVRAVDGKGNTGSWSGWSQFSITLS